MKRRAYHAGQPMVDRPHVCGTWRAGLRPWTNGWPISKAKWKSNHDWVATCALQKAFPPAQWVPCEAIEGEAIHLEVHLPKNVDLALAQDEALDLKHAIEDRYGLYILLRVVLEKS